MTRPSTADRDRTAPGRDPTPAGASPGSGTATSGSATSGSTPSGSPIRRRVVGVAFWTAVALPLVYLPLLAAGPVSGMRLLAVVSLVALNLLALAVGHPYGRG